MNGSGATTLSTNGDGAITLIAANGSTFLSITLSNESGTAGAFSLDAGATWQRWPAGGKSATIRTFINQDVQFKRIAGGTDVTGLSGFCSN